MWGRERSQDDSRVLGLSHWKDELLTVQMGHVWEGPCFHLPICPSVCLSVHPSLFPFLHWPSQYKAFVFSLGRRW